MISLHGFELSNEIGCNNLIGPIGLHVILADAWRQIWREELLCSFINAVLQLGGLIHFRHVICNK